MAEKSLQKKGLYVRPKTVKKVRAKKASNKSPRKFRKSKCFSTERWREAKTTKAGVHLRAMCVKKPVRKAKSGAKKSGAKKAAKKSKAKSKKDCHAPNTWVSYCRSPRTSKK
jgi:hypothetical protein